MMNTRGNKVGNTVFKIPLIRPRLWLSSLWSDEAGVSMLLPIMIGAGILTTITYILTTYVPQLRRETARSSKYMQYRNGLASAISYATYVIQQRNCIQSDSTPAVQLTTRNGQEIRSVSGSGTMLPTDPTTPCGLNTPLNLERLLLGDSTAQELEKLGTTGGTTLTGTQLDEVRYTVNLKNMTDQHPLKVVANNLLPELEDLTFVISRYRNKDQPAAGREALLKVRAEGTRSTSINKFLDRAVSSNVFIESFVAFYPREMNTFALVVKGNIDLDTSTDGGCPDDPNNNICIPYDSTKAANDKGLHFLGPVFTNGNLLLPPFDPKNPKYNNTTFADMLYLGKGPNSGMVGFKNGSSITPFRPKGLGDPTSRYQAQIPTFGGTLGGVKVDSFDKGLDFLFGSNASASATIEANKDKCVTKQLIRADLTKSRDARLLVKGASSSSGTSVYQMGLSHGDEFVEAGNPDPAPGTKLPTVSGNPATYTAGAGGPILRVYVKAKNFTGESWGTGTAAPGFFGPISIQRNGSLTLNFAGDKTALEGQLVAGSDLARLKQAQSTAATTCATMAGFDSATAGVKMTHPSCVTSTNTGGDAKTKCAAVAAGATNDCANTWDAVDAVFTGYNSPPTGTAAPVHPASNLTDLTAAKTSFVDPIEKKVQDYPATGAEPSLQLTASDIQITTDGVAEPSTNQINLTVKALNFAALDGTALPEIVFQAIDFGSTATGDDAATRLAQSPAWGPNLDPTKLTTGQLKFDPTSFKPIWNSAGWTPLSPNNGTSAPWTLTSAPSDTENPGALKCSAGSKSDSAFGSAGEDVDFSSTARASWNFRPYTTDLIAGIVGGTASSIKNIDFNIYSVVKYDGSHGVCKINSDVNFISGFFVCDRLEIADRPSGQALWMVGTWIIGNLKISKSALAAGINFSTIYHPQAQALLKQSQSAGAAPILRPYVFTTPVPVPAPACPDVPDKPIWSASLSTRDYMNGFRCTPSYLRSQADPFQWSAVSPTCGIQVAANGTPDGATTCKTRYRPLRFKIVEISRSERIQ